MLNMSLVRHSVTNCDKTYLGKTGRKLGIRVFRLQEHRMEVDSKTKRAFTRSQHTASLSEHNKSTLADHAIKQNHVIDWSQATVTARLSHHWHQMDLGISSHL